VSEWLTAQNPIGSQFEFVHFWEQDDEKITCVSRITRREGRMTVAQDIQTWLVEHKRNAYCARCILEGVHHVDLGRVRDLTATLANEPGYHRFVGLCHHCGEKRQVMRADG